MAEKKASCGLPDCDGGPFSRPSDLWNHIRMKADHEPEDGPHSQIYDVEDKETVKEVAKDNDEVTKNLIEEYRENNAEKNPESSEVSDETPGQVVEIEEETEENTNSQDFPGYIQLGKLDPENLTNEEIAWAKKAAAKYSWKLPIEDNPEKKLSERRINP
jgi:hypothetical protein